MPEANSHTFAALSAAQLDVLARWNAAGAATVRQLSAEPAATSVYFAGPESTELSAELQARIPGLVVSETAATASVAVVTIGSAAAPSGEELRPVRSATEAGCQVLLAMTGIDRNRDWREVRSSATDILLAREPGGQAPQIWPVAPRLASIARSQELPPAEAILVDACSGISELEAALGAALQSPADPARPAAVQTAAVQEALRRITVTRKSVAAASGDEDLRAERARLALRRDGGRSETASAVRSALGLARVDLLHEAGAGLRTINNSAREEVDRSSREQLKQYPERLQQYVDAFAADLAAMAQSRLTAVARENGLAPVLVEPLQAPGPGPAPEPRRSSLEDQMILVTGASAGVGIGRLAVSPLALTPALDYATWPATLLLGGAAAWWLTRSRKHLAARAAMRQWVNDALVNVKGQLEQQLVASIMRTETALAGQITARSTERTVEVDAQLAAIDNDLRARAARRQAQAQACDRDRAALSS